ncbi:MAG: protease inhibitor I42 family protein [Chloroflexi bacterium]|nr:protease inhibitor I42 family protein [Chloroflexota bacterium]
MKKILSLIAVFVLALAGCERKSESSNQPAELQISNPTKQLEAEVGNEFKIVIDSNPTTGYHWELVGEMDENIVEFVSRDYRADTPQTVGSGGVDVWVFKALAVGETTIMLGYYPPGDSTEAQQTVTFNVVVK